MFRRLLAMSALCLSLGVGSVFAQDTGNSGNSNRDTTASARSTDPNRHEGFNPGWLGLVGLVGLAGLVRRDRRDH